MDVWVTPQPEPPSSRSLIPTQSVSLTKSLSPSKGRRDERSKADLTNLLKDVPGSPDLTCPRIGPRISPDLPLVSDLPPYGTIIGELPPQIEALLASPWPPRRKPVLDGIHHQG